MDVGAPEVGLIALPPSRAGEAWSGRKPSWRRSFVRFLARLLQQQAVHDPAVLLPAEDLILSMSSTMSLSLPETRTFPRKQRSFVLTGAGLKAIQRIGELIGVLPASA
jgi:hypothetical protein